ncbi:hypothetical protein V5O48_000219 [Marasmius crinis-equi]|uniref:Uncharacterized protein n=1 Tax=Marasmius crinis-equi TaxID=585013 RepID=A0ABR3G1Y0_9AGAR
MSFPNSQGETFDHGQFNNVAGEGMSFFSNSNGATFYDGQFNSIAGNQYNHSTYNNNNNNTYNNTYSTVNPYRSTNTLASHCRRRRITQLGSSVSPTEMSSGDS